jgi:hypothetical protein
MVTLCTHLLTSWCMFLQTVYNYGNLALYLLLMGQTNVQQAWCHYLHAIHHRILKFCYIADNSLHLCCRNILPLPSVHKHTFHCKMKNLSLRLHYVCTKRTQRLTNINIKARNLTLFSASSTHLRTISLTFISVSLTILEGNLSKMLLLLVTRP